MSRRARSAALPIDHESTAPDPEPDAMTPARSEAPTNGNGTPTPLVRVDDHLLVWRASDADDIIVWRASDDEVWTPSHGSVGGALAAAPEPAGPVDADEWLRAGTGSRFVNLHFIIGALARRRSWLVGFAIAGVVLGLLLSVVSAPAPRAETTVLLTHPNAGDRALGMATDAQLLETNAVAGRVVHSLHLGESPDAFASTYNGTVLSDDLLSISVSASSESDAIRRANVLAREYLAYRAKVYARQSNAIIEGLQKRQAAIQAEIGQLNQQLGAHVDSTTSTDPATAALLARRASLDQDLTALSGAIADQTNSSAAIVEGSSAIDQATPVESSMIKDLLRNALSGLAAGLVIGLAIVVLLAVTSNRVWRRDDVAEAIRHSVDLSTGAIRVGRWTSTVKMETLVANPTPELERLVGHLRAALAASNDRSLAVIAVGGLEVAAVAVCAAAATLVREGETVAVVDASERGIVSGRGVLAQAGSEPDARDPSSHVRLAPLTEARAEAPADADEIVLVLATLDPAEGAERLRALASNAVVLVTAGRSTMATLRAVSDMLEVAHVALQSVVLVGASKYDESFGRRADDDAGAPTLSDEPDVAVAPDRGA